MPQRMYYIDQARAMLEGFDLGRPARIDENPTIGDVLLPARGVLAIGQAMWEIRDLDEYSRTRAPMVKEPL